MMSETPDTMKATGTLRLSSPAGYPGWPMETGTFRVKSGLAEMLKGGVIMDVTDAEQARIAEDAGACAVMALERVPADIRKDGGVARMSDPAMIQGIILFCLIVADVFTRYRVVIARRAAAAT